MSTKSLQFKITLMMVCAIVVSMFVTTVIAGVIIGKLTNNLSNNTLYLLCENGEKNIDSYLDSVMRSVGTVSQFAREELKNEDISDLSEHVARVKGAFAHAANNTDGILTYYYRIDPDVSKTEKGFWYVDLDGAGFQEHEVTNIELYDTSDTSSLVWFTQPKATGEPIWLKPYYTDNLDVYVISYNVPIYKDNVFIGVIGIEIDYDTIAKLVDGISLYENGYAFINDSDGNIICHPRLTGRSPASCTARTR